MTEYVLDRHLANHQPLIGDATYDSAGIARMVLGAAPAGYFLEVERIVADSGLGATDFTLYAAQVDVRIHVRERALFTADTILVFDEQSVVRFFPGEAIIARFTGGTAGDTAFVVLQAFTVLYETVVIGDSNDPQAAYATGIADTGSGLSPDPGGWN